MNSANKIGLLKNALKMLTNQLNQKDSVAIVVYAGAAGVVLKPTKGDNKPAIIDALSQLVAGGSTNGGAGIEAAYRLAQQSFIKGGINRIMLATDGDFNVGTVNNQALKNLIENKRKSGIDLSILGFGIGNYNDELMQQLAQNGNGNAYYIDNLHEARKVLVEELSSTLFTIAKDVKIQVEFNPNVVSEYRLIGYETRALKREDFNNDNVDAGEIGAGHTVTAIYEISLANGKNKANDTLRYQTQNIEHKSTAENQNEFAFLRLRYKTPTENNSRLIEVPLLKSDIVESLATTSNSYKFSAAVAGFSQLLRGGENLSTMNIKDIINLAQQGRGEDIHGYRGEFINMVKLAQALSPQLIADNSASNAVDHE
jgi:Ca-activated chloride channel family protein